MDYVQEFNRCEKVALLFLSKTFQHSFTTHTDVLSKL